MNRDPKLTQDRGDDLPLDSIPEPRHREAGIICRKDEKARLQLVPGEDLRTVEGPTHLEGINTTYEVHQNSLKRKKQSDWLQASASYVGRLDTLVVIALRNEP
jgi:hypothetical protein